MRDAPDFGRGWLKRVFLGRELAAFWRYLRRPRLAPRLRRPDDAPVWLADWLPACPWRLLLAWAVFLWGVSLLILGPMLLWAAAASGAEHALSSLTDAGQVPVLFAIVAAPIAEELIFRLALRRPGQVVWLLALILIPAFAAAWWFKLRWLGFALGLAVAVIVSCGVMRRATRRPGGRYLGRWGWRWRRVYVRHFGWVFHAAALAFALVHLINYQFSDALWLAPLMVCPQWLGGLVMGWMRVTRSLGSSIALHACYNAGPVLLLWGWLTLQPDFSA